MTMSPLRSFLLKLGLLAIAASLVLWIGWPTGERLDLRPAASGKPRDLQQQEQPTLSTSSQTPASTPTGPSRSDDRNSVRTHFAKLDLNLATSAQLQELPGIGQALAQRVIDRREAKGRFQTVDDLLEVKGIGSKRLKQLRPLLTIGPAAPSQKRL